METSINYIHTALVVAKETEQIGADTLVDLAAQEEQVARQRTRLAAIRAQLDRGGVIVRSMYKKIITDRHIIACLAVAIIILLMYVFLAYWYNKD